MHSPEVAFSPGPIIADMWTCSVNMKCDFHLIYSIPTKYFYFEQEGCTFSIYHMAHRQRPPTSSTIVHYFEGLLIYPWLSIFILTMISIPRYVAWTSNSFQTRDAINPFEKAHLSLGSLFIKLLSNQISRILWLIYLFLLRIHREYLSWASKFNQVNRDHFELSFNDIPRGEARQA